MIQIEFGANGCASMLTCRKLSTEWNPSSCDHRLCTIRLVPAVAYATRACCCCCFSLFRNLSFYSSAYGEYVCADTYVAHCNTKQNKKETKSAPFPICSFAQIRLNPPLRNRCCIVLCMRVHSMHWTEIRSNDRTKDEIIRNTCTRTTSA